MQVRGSRVGIIGGSIAGCAAAIALERLGCDVHVFERSSGVLRDRGSGIAISPTLRDELIETGYLPADYANCLATVRWWVLADGSASGRVLWTQPARGAHNNWGVLWRSLRAGVNDTRYQDGVTLRSFDQDADGVTAVVDEVSSHRFDVLIAADGYRSAIRQQVIPGSRPQYAGYILWRGNYPESRLRNRAAIVRGTEAGVWHYICLDGGHGIVYMIPDFDDRADPGHRRVNWAIYAPAPPGLDFSDPTSIPPGEVTPDLYRHLDRLLTSAFPPDYEAVVRASPIEEVSIQPIYDELVDSYVYGRVVLIGDAATVTRPHTGSGASKALEDALCLERLGKEHGDWSDLLAAYDAERSAAGASLVRLGRRLGRDLVEQTPDWASMSAEDFDAWTRNTLSGERLYLYGNVAEPVVGRS
jgi:2-polyprenyl-6-methoxyphenol hydroxylase-like FAD-dependent oxidoreductase